MNPKRLSSVQRYFILCFEYLDAEYSDVKQELDKDDVKLAEFKAFLKGCYTSRLTVPNGVGDYIHAIRNEEKTT